MIYVAIGACVELLAGLNLDIWSKLSPSPALVQ